MAIVLYSGLPGSGKTYGVVEHVILPALAEGRSVYTNIPLRIEKFREFSSLVLPFDVEEAKKRPSYLTEIPGGAVVVVDEAWRLWPSGLKASNVPEEHKAFLAEHRHKVGIDGRSQEIVLVTQDGAQLAAFVRQLIDETYRSVKMDKVGAPGTYRIDVYMGVVTGQRPPDRPLRKIPGRYRPEIYQYYRSHTKSATGGAGKEEKIDKRANALRAGIIRYGIPLGVLALVLGGYMAYQAIFRVVGSDDIKPTSDGTKPVLIRERKHDELENKEEEKKSLQNNYSETWRLAAYLASEESDKKIAVVISSRGLREIDPANCHVIPGTRGYACEVDGEIATVWTGPKRVSWVSTPKEPAN